MSISDAQRLELHKELENVFTPASVTTLMELLPPVGFTDLATKEHVENSAARIRSEMAVGFAEMNARFAEMNARFDTAEAKAEARSADTDAKILGMETRVVRDQRVFTFALLSSVTAIAMVALTIMGLG